MVRILNILPKYPLPAMSGGDLCSINIMKAQKKIGMKVDILCFEGENKHKVNGGRGIFWDEEYIVDPPSRLMKLFCMAKEPSLPYWVASRFSPFMRDRLDEIIKKNEYDFIQIEHTNMGQYAKYIKKGKVYLNVHSLTMLAFHRFYQKESRRIRKMALNEDARRLLQWESDLFKSGLFEGVFFLSKKDMDIVKGIAGGIKNMKILPLPIDIESIPAGNDDEKHGSYDILMVGSMDNPSNEDAARWFSLEIFNNILEKIPNARLTIVGKSVNARVRDLAKLGNVRLISDAEELSSYYQEATLVVVPVRGGAGARTKLLEAMAYGKPVVTSPIGIESMPDHRSVFSGQPYITAETNIDFAKKCIDILLNPGKGREIGRAARSYIERFYSVDACSKILADVYHIS